MTDSQYIVVEGNVDMGHTFYGPFDDAESANKFGGDTCVLEWLSIRLEPVAKAKGGYYWSDQSRNRIGKGWK